MLSALAGLAAAAAAVSGGSYHVCIFTDAPVGNVVIRSSDALPDKQIFMTRAAAEFCATRGLSSCQARDFSQAECGAFMPWTLLTSSGEPARAPATVPPPKDQPVDLRLRKSLP